MLMRRLVVEAGIDVLNPIQWRLPGIARQGLKADFGDRLVLHGAAMRRQPPNLTPICDPESMSGLNSRCHSVFERGTD